MNRKIIGCRVWWDIRSRWLHLIFCVPPIASFLYATYYYFGNSYQFRIVLVGYFGVLFSFGDNFLFFYPSFQQKIVEGSIAKLAREIEYTNDNNNNDNLTVVFKYFSMCVCVWVCPIKMEIVQNKWHAQYCIVEMTPPLRTEDTICILIDNKFVFVVVFEWTYIRPI